MYTNKALAVKVVFAVLLPAVFMAVNFLMLDNAIAAAHFVYWPPLLLFFIPFYATYFMIRQTPAGVSERLFCEGSVVSVLSCRRFDGCL